MRIYFSKRIFMNEADSSPGNGAQVDPPAPAQPTAPSGSDAPSIDAIKGTVNELLSGFRNELTSWKNGFFADARKAGAIGKEKPSPEPQAPQPPPASSGLSAADVESMLETERVVMRVQIENKLTDAQLKRMKSALKADKPEDVSAWAATYLADMGFARQTEQPAVTPSPAPAPSGAPVSDKGSPAPGQATSWERELTNNPLSMSSAARSAMFAKFGELKAKQMIIEAVNRVNGSMKVTPK